MREKKHSNKKAQITIFVILGIVIFGVVMLFLSLQKKDTTTNDIIDQTATRTIISNIESYSNQCFEDIVERSIISVLMQGGRYELENVEHATIGNFKIPYYLKNKEIKILTEEEIIESFKKMLKKDFDSCVDNYNIFKNYDIEIQKEETQIEIESNEGLTIKINPKLTMNQEETQHYSQELTKFIRLDLAPILRATTQIVNRHINFEPRYIGTSIIVEETQKEQIHFDVLGHQEDVIIILKPNEESIFPLMFMMDLNT